MPNSLTVQKQSGYGGYCTVLPSSVDWAVLELCSNPLIYKSLREVHFFKLYQDYQLGQEDKAKRNCKGRVVHHAMKKHWGSGGIRWRWRGQLHVPGGFTPGERAPHNHWIGGWVDRRDGLDAVAKKKNPIIGPAENRTPVVQPVA
jgi:hypothetical protein